MDESPTHGRRTVRGLMLDFPIAQQVVMTADQARKLPDILRRPVRIIGC